MLGSELGADKPVGNADELWDELKQRARQLVDRLESGDLPAANAAIEDLREARDRSIYREVGKLTRGLHDAIVNFEIDASHPGVAGDSQMANAQDRLGYVINLTQRSADKTMDMVEEGIPLVNSLGERATELKRDWERLLRREMDSSEFRGLYHRIDEFLVQSAQGSQDLSEKLNAILLAQDFQDLTGQVIKKVISLVQDVEVRLVELMRVAGEVEELTGIVREPRAEKASISGPDTVAEGPQVKAGERADVVAGQDDVDDLLSSLGF